LINCLQFHVMTFILIRWPKLCKKSMHRLDSFGCHDMISVALKRFDRQTRLQLTHISILSRYDLNNELQVDRKQSSPMNASKRWYNFWDLMNITDYDSWLIFSADEIQNFQLLFKVLKIQNSSLLYNRKYRFFTSVSYPKSEHAIYLFWASFCLISSIYLQI
jgi:hypothetical protein